MKLTNQKLSFDETKEKSNTVRPFLLKFSQGLGVPEEIHIIPKGEWNHPVYGKMEITDSELTTFKQHFEDGIRKDIPITEGHARDGEEKPAVGWFKKLIHRENGLWAIVEWTKAGQDLLTQKAYKYFSPEFYQIYEDPETRQRTANVIVGGALTNQPYFKGLAPVVLSEFIINSFSEETKMNLKDLLKKKASELSKEEKEFMKAKKTEMSETEQETFKEVFSEEPVAEAGDKTEDPKEPVVEAGDKVDEETPKVDPAPEKVEASEKVIQVKASEFSELQANAELGKKAFAELQAKNIAEAVSKLTFSESNKTGRFLPKTKSSLQKFMESLTETQRVAFSEIVSEIPEVKIFGEIGSEGADTDSAASEVNREANALMKDNDKLSFSEAIRQLGSAKPELMRRYNEEMTR